MRRVRWTAGIVLAVTQGVAAQQCLELLHHEDFDDFVAGVPLIEQQACHPECPAGFSWQAWEDLPTAGFAAPSDEQAESGPNSLEIIGGAGTGGVGADDLVHTYFDLELRSEGIYQYEIDVYVPGDFAGDSYFILLNEYRSGGPHNWSTQIHWNSLGQVISDFDDGIQNEVAIIPDAWVTLSVLFDLGLNRQTIRYGGELVVTKLWCDFCQFNTFDAMNLFGNDATPVYYDNARLCEVSPIGACCRRDGSCLSVDEVDCLAIDDGVFQGVGSTCELGACLVYGPNGWIITGGDRENPTRFAGDTCRDYPGKSECPLQESPDNLWEVFIPWSQTWTFSVCDAEFDSLLYLSSDMACSDTGLVADDTDGCGVASVIEHHVEAPATVYVTLEGFVGDCGRYTLEVSAPGPPCVTTGDVDHSGCVDFADVLTVLANWGTNGPDGDADCDDFVGFADILVVLGEWAGGC